MNRDEVTGFQVMLSDFAMDMNPGGSIWVTPKQVVPDQPITVEEILVPGMGIKSLELLIHLSYIRSDDAIIKFMVDNL